MRAYCAASGVPIAVVTQAKETPGFDEHFKGSRVCTTLTLALAKRPFETHSEALDKEQLECERIERQNRKMDFEHQVKLGAYTKNDIVREKFAKAMEAAMDAMKGLMTREDFNACIKQIKANIRSLDL